MGLPHDLANKNFSENTTMQAPQPKKEIIFVVFHMAKLEKTLVLLKHTTSAYLLEKTEQRSHRKGQCSVLCGVKKGYWSFLFLKGSAMKAPCPHHLECLLGVVAPEVARSPSLLPVISSTITGKKSRKKHLNSVQFHSTI